MTDLSPAAQAVLTAVTQRQYCLDPCDVPEATGRIRYEAAAALRAAAKQSTFADVAVNKTIEVVPVDILLAIADELEGIKYGTYRSDLTDRPQ